MMLTFAKKRLLNWQTLLAVLTIALVVVAEQTTPGFLGSLNIQSSLSNLADISLMTLPLAMLVICREIDISVASIAGFSSCVAGTVMEHSSSLALVVLVAVVVGVACGALNGFCVTVLRLPSLVVTLGTLSLFRGLCYVVLGTSVVTTVPAGLSSFSNNSFLGTPVPDDLLPYLILVPVFWLALHRSITGRRIYAMGGNPETARYTGVNRTRIVFMLFVVSGALCSVAGLINVGITSEVSPDGLLGNELFALTVVFLGGVSFLGGKGNITGVVWAFALLVVLTSVLQLHNVSTYSQDTAIGVLLIGSLLLVNSGRRISATIRQRRDRVAAVEPGADPLEDAGTDQPNQKGALLR